ncbi:tRNA-dependent cyclodipeptide synthase [Streptomyces sp. NPDC101227]|uniref:tRNA-dependent cyclodipeptide synthase n=1 Tax=Streptomyces sp. NPDC101227 TaxID=3366136 RepID=UPI00382188D5
MTTATEIFHVRPYTPHCQVITDEGDHAVIGISPGNSYFTHQRVLSLAAWGLENFRQVDLIYTDLHVADMYEALGYTTVDAQRKAVKNLRGVRAKVTAAVATLDPDGIRLRGRPMSALLGLPAYRVIREGLDDRLSADPAFRDVCDQLVVQFLTSKVLDGQHPTDRQRQVCLDYICAEAPLFIDTPAIMGVPSSLNCYHQALPMADLLYSRGHGLRATRNQGHAVITPAGTITEGHDQ